jgi:hypothetical protein
MRFYPAKKVAVMYYYTADSDFELPFFDWRAGKQIQCGILGRAFSAGGGVGAEFLGRWPRLVEVGRAVGASEQRRFQLRILE